MILSQDHRLAILETRCIKAAGALHAGHDQMRLAGERREVSGDSDVAEVTIAGPGIGVLGGVGVDDAIL